MGAGASSGYEEDPDDLKAKGNAAFKAGEYIESIVWYSKAIEQNAAGPALSALHSNRSAAYLAERCYGRALMDAEAAARLRPQWAKPYFRMGLALLELLRDADAADCFQRAISLEPQNADLKTHLAKCKTDVNARGAGYLLSWGCGDQGALGHGDTRDRSSARAIDEFRGKHIVDVACGMCHTVALSSNGEAHSWGANAQNQCGLDPPGGKGANDNGAGAHREAAVPFPRVIPALLGVRCS